MTVSAVLTVLTVLGSALPSFCLSYEIQCQETSVTVLTVLAVSAVSAVSVVTATPLKNSTPLCRHPDRIMRFQGRGDLVTGARCCFSGCLTEGLRCNHQPTF